MARLQYLGCALAAATLLAAGCVEEDLPNRDEPAPPKPQGYCNEEALAGRAPPPGQPPGPSPTAVPATGPVPTTLAISRVTLGSSTTDTSEFWRFGFDLDGIDNQLESSPHGCDPPHFLQRDGCNGIDNAFGLAIFPKIYGGPEGNRMGRVTTETTRAIENGTWTLMFHFENLGTAADQIGVVGAVLTGAAREARPVWDGSDVWPVAWDSVHDGDLQRPRTSFDQSHVSSGRWVARLDELPFALRATETWIPLPLRHAIVALDISGIGSSATGINGVIAGVLDPEPLVASVRESLVPIWGCSYSAWFLVRDAADVLPDLGRDPDAPCAAISFGIGFEARPVVVGEVAPATRRARPVCP